MKDKEGHLRCDGCGKMLALRLEGKLEIVCPRCKRYNQFVMLAEVCYNENEVLVKTS